MTPLSLSLYRAATALAEPFAPLLLKRRANRGKEDLARIGERLGTASAARPDGPLAWLHGASVGESLSLLPLIDALSAKRPELRFLVTAGTVTAAQLLEARLPPGALHQYAPIDGPKAVSRALAHWRPNLIIRAESELWPNLILSAKAGGVKLALLSARLSEASAEGWRRWPAGAKALLGAFDLVMAQDEESAARLEALGAHNHGLLNLKTLGAPLPVDEAVMAEFRATLHGRPVLLAVSTHPGEDDIALDVFDKLAARADRPLLVIVPRHPERGAEIATLCASRSLAVARRSKGEAPSGAVYVADTLGELGLWYRLANAALIGGSLLPGVGGHNPL